MEFWRGHNLDRISRAERLRIAHVQAVLAGMITQRDPTPAPVADALFSAPPVDNSTRIPGAIGSVLLPGEYEFEEPVYHPSPYLVQDDAGFGFDSEGNYHCPGLRTEHIVEL